MILLEINVTWTAAGTSLMRNGPGAKLSWLVHNEALEKDDYLSTLVII